MQDVEHLSRLEAQNYAQQFSTIWPWEHHISASLSPSVKNRIIIVSQLSPGYCGGRAVNICKGCGPLKALKKLKVSLLLIFLCLSSPFVNSHLVHFDSCFLMELCPKRCWLEMSPPATTTHNQSLLGTDPQKSRKYKVLLL